MIESRGERRLQHMIEVRLDGADRFDVTYQSWSGNRWNGKPLCVSLVRWASGAEFSSRGTESRLTLESEVIVRGHMRKVDGTVGKSGADMRRRLDTLPHPVVAAALREYRKVYKP